MPLLEKANQNKNFKFDLLDYLGRFFIHSGNSARLLVDTPDNIQKTIEDSQTQVLITLDLSSLYDKVKSQLGFHGLRHLVVGQVGDLSADPGAVNDQLLKAGQLSIVHEAEGLVRFNELLEHTGELSAYRPKVQAYRDRYGVEA